MLSFIHRGVFIEFSLSSVAEDGAWLLFVSVFPRIHSNSAHDFPVYIELNDRLSVS